MSEPTVSVPGEAAPAEAPAPADAPAVEVVTTEAAAVTPAAVLPGAEAGAGADALAALMARLDSLEQTNAELRGQLLVQQEQSQALMDQMLDASAAKSGAPPEADAKPKVDISTTPEDWSNRTSMQAAAAGLKARVLCIDGWYTPEQAAA